MDSKCSFVPLTVVQQQKKLTYKYFLNVFVFVLKKKIVFFFFNELLEYVFAEHI